jgi:hypothetical protein
MGRETNMAKLRRGGAVPQDNFNAAAPINAQVALPAAPRLNFM